MTAPPLDLRPARQREGLSVSATGLGMEYPTAAGTVRALDEVSVRFPAGTSTAIVGASGCGKSTLLGLLAGLERPTTGQVRVGDRVISALSERERVLLRRRSFGLIFQADNLQPYLTAAENVALQAVLAGLPEDRGRVKALLDCLAVGTLGHRFPDQLSGGERQRVAVARALVHHPRVVFADEPTGSLDARSSERVVDLLLDASRQVGATLLIVTHDRSVAARADRTVEMRDGSVPAGQDAPT